MEYIVKPGDNLWDIADKYLGNPFRWKEILDAYNAQNKDKPIIVKIAGDLVKPII
ncbi:MAG: LysM peptidoglycan-binding domain-containing protein [Candidatus Omnitrophica bacterium]|nr:LysM peptidoglycan-binding domain-containing protein [Candidatus Omnitrophota bacterium]